MPDNDVRNKLCILIVRASRWRNKLRLLQYFLCLRLRLSFASILINAPVSRGSDREFRRARVYRIISTFLPKGD